MAWLHAAPKKHNKDEDPQPRLNTLPDGHQSKCLPEIYDYIATCFELSGYCLSGSLGATPLTWTEIDAFCNRSGYKLRGWDVEQLIKMSRTYCSMLTKASKIGFPAPYQQGISSEEALQEMRDRVARQWEAFESNYQNK